MIIKSKEQEKKIRYILVERGKILFQKKAGASGFTKQKEADDLVSNLEEFPHAFVLACVMDRQVKAETAWMVPYELRERIGDFSFSTLNNLSLDEVILHMNKPTALHRFPDKMGDFLYQAIKTIGLRYNGNASKIWADKPSSAEVVYRFLEFDGVGPKIATMAANILVRDFGIEFSDYYSIDISADVHVRRVFTRLGLIEKGATVEKIIYRARTLYPKFPGMIDFPVWDIGRNWCKPGHPLCNGCYMNNVCNYNQN